MILIDTHAHIYATEFADDREQVMQRAADAGVTQILMPAIDESTHQAMLDMEARYPSTCLSMMGLHPCSVKENYQEELDSIAGHFAKRKFVAVGETGLDFYWDLQFADQQYLSFRRQVEWALEFDIPVVIHSRSSTDECIRLIKEYQKGSLKGVFHCFSGTAEQAQQIVDLGFYLGIGGVLTFKNAGLDTALKNIDISHVVLETDAPYLSPVPYRGKRNECSYIQYIAQKLAVIKNISTVEAAEITTANAQKLFGL